MERKLPPITVVDIDGGRDYDDTEDPSRLFHHGQRKLLLSELQFITDCLSSRDDQGLFVYAGAAPGLHIHALLKVFPNIRLLLFDPEPFSIRSESPDTVAYVDTIVNIVTEDVMKKHEKTVIESCLGSDQRLKILIVQDYFSEEYAEALEGHNIFFISDIRTSSPDGKSPTDAELLYDCSQQFNWTHLMKPRASMLKFRMPYFREEDRISIAKIADRIPDSHSAFVSSKSKGIDFLGEYEKGNFVYFNGELRLQCWSRVLSAETRMFFRGIPTTKQHDIKGYERKMFYYNTLLRRDICYYNPMFDMSVGFDLCADCALESLIVMGYDTKYKANIRLTWLDTCSRACGIHRSLVSKGHGSLIREPEGF